MCSSKQQKTLQIILLPPLILFILYEPVCSILCSYNFECLPLCTLSSGLDIEHYYSLLQIGAQNETAGKTFCISPSLGRHREFNFQKQFFKLYFFSRVAQVPHSVIVCFVCEIRLAAKKERHDHCSRSHDGHALQIQNFSGS